MMDKVQGRIIFDLSTTMRWTGPPVGIVRVERELASWARKNVHGILFVFFNPVRKTFQELPSETAGAFLSGQAILDTLGVPDAAPSRRRKSDRIPHAIRPALLWIFQFRRKLVQSLERLRLRVRAQPMAAMVDTLQRPLIGRKYRNIMIRPDGSRNAYIPFDMLDGSTIELNASDVLICAGAGWAHLDIRTNQNLKSAIGFRMAHLCYDIIPLQYPHFYRAHDVEAFREYFERAFAFTDLVIFTSRKVEGDVRAYCAGHKIALQATAVTPLGASAGPGRCTAAELPLGLQAGQYALLVSTIEPRKGHRMIYNVWRRLLDEGIPQAKGFKILFVGRPGWLVDDLMRDLVEDPRIKGSLHILKEVDDDMLATLYRDAAFCLYPSIYEGYGLPVIEALSHGKPMLASNGGALPEVVGKFSPCLDPDDEDAWHRTLKHWIVEPAARSSYEAAIKSDFKHPSWDDAALQFFATIDRAMPVN